MNIVLSTKYRPIHRFLFEGGSFLLSAIKGSLKPALVLFVKNRHVTYITGILESNHMLKAIPSPLINPSQVDQSGQRDALSGSVYIRGLASFTRCGAQ